MKDLIIKIGDRKYYLLVVNENLCFFTVNSKNYIFIDFHELSDYFDVRSGTEKTNIFNCSKLELHKIDYEKMRSTHHLEIMSNIRSLKEVNTFDWLIAHGVDIRTNNGILRKWAEYRKNKELVAHFKKLDSCTIQEVTKDICAVQEVIEKKEIIPKEILCPIKEVMISSLKEAITDTSLEQMIIPEQKQYIVCFLLELISKTSIDESIITDLIGAIKKTSFSPEQLQPMINLVMEMIQNKEISSSINKGAADLLAEIFRKKLTAEQRQSIINFMIKTVSGI